MMMKYKIRAVLFDLDGVLVFTDKYHYLGWKRLSDEMGWAFDWDLNHQLRGISRMASLQVILDHNGVSLPEEEKVALADRKNAYYVASLAQINDEDLYPGGLAFLEALQEREATSGLNDVRTFERFRHRVEQSRKDLMRILNDLEERGKRVVGYAATSKSTTVINYCGITPDLLEYISDTTPLKQGKYSPGMHVPIRPYEDFKATYPDYALLFGWNHAEEIMAKERAFRAAGGKWITYVPKVQILQ